MITENVIFQEMLKQVQYNLNEVSLITELLLSLIDKYSDKERHYFCLALVDLLKAAQYGNDKRTKTEEAFFDTKEDFASEEKKHEYSAAYHAAKARKHAVNALDADDGFPKVTHGIFAALRLLLADACQKAAKDNEDSNE